MAAYAFTIISIYIASHRMSILFHPENRILGAINDTLIAFNASDVIDVVTTLDILVTLVVLQSTGTSFPGRSAERTGNAV